MVYKKYCGVWSAFNLEDRSLTPMQGSAPTIIKLFAWTKWRSWIEPEVLIYESSFQGSKDETKVVLEGTVTVDTSLTSRAIATFQRVGGKYEMSVKQYYLMKNDEIFVVAMSDDEGRNGYKNHVLRRESR
ncbi:MAG TPA: hypothetical protein VG711_07845 [Phycisphaerales bacterium]|nr:hypothetical protein [Phycisphaerales bacterium]